MIRSKFSRRDFLRFSAAGAAAIGATPASAADAPAVVKKKAGPVCESGGCCITQSGDFYNVERGNPLPYKLPLEKQQM